MKLSSEQKEPEATFRRKMPLEAEFVQYLASLNSSEAEFNSLSLVERSSIRRNFSPPAPAQGNYLFHFIYFESV